MLKDFQLIKKKSPVQGLGIFTKTFIKKGETFYKIPESKIITHNHDHAARIGGNKYVWDEEVLNYVNHSCDPNAEINLANLTLIALKNIKPEQEITCDYDYTEGDYGYNFVCKCGQKNCRNQIGSILKSDN